MQRILRLAAVLVGLALAGCGKPPTQPVEQPGYENAPPSQAAVTQPKPEPDTPAAGEPTDFEASDLQGNPVKLSSFKGKPIVLDFWATWCPPCRAAMPRLSELQTKLKDQNLVVVAVSMDETRDVVEQWVKDNPSDMTILWLDPAEPDAEKASKAYDVQGIPTTVYISKDWKVVERGVGLHDMSEYTASAGKLVLDTSKM